MPLFFRSKQNRTSIAIKNYFAVQLKQLKIMADNNIPIPPNAEQDPEYDGDAAYRAYLNAVAPPIPPGQVQEFGPAEIPVRASLLRGDSALMQNFSSRGLLLSPNSITSSPIQIVQLIREVSIFLSLEPDWLRQPNNFSIYVALRLRITVGPDGDSINQFKVKPADVESTFLVIYPQCTTTAGLLTSTTTPLQTQTLLLQFMPLYWNSSRRMETVLVRNYPFDNFGSHTRLPLHLIAKYFDSCLHDELQYYMVLTPAGIGKSKTTEGVVRVFLPAILPGLTMDLSAAFCTAVGLSSNQPVILSFGWTNILMAGNLGKFTSCRIHPSIWGRHSAGDVYFRGSLWYASSCGPGLTLGGR